MDGLCDQYVDAYFMHGCRVSKNADNKNITSSLIRPVSVTQRIREHDFFSQNMDVRNLILCIFLPRNFSVAVARLFFSCLFQQRIQKNLRRQNICVWKWNVLQKDEFFLLFSFLRFLLYSAHISFDMLDINYGMVIKIVTVLKLL